MIHNPSTETQVKCKHYKQIVHKTFRRDKILAERKTLEKLEKDRNSPKEIFQILKEWSPPIKKAYIRHCNKSTCISICFMVKSTFFGHYACRRFPIISFEIHEVYTDCLIRCKIMQYLHKINFASDWTRYNIIINNRIIFDKWVNVYILVSCQYTNRNGRTQNDQQDYQGVHVSRILRGLVRTVRGDFAWKGSEIYTTVWP